MCLALYVITYLPIFFSLFTQAEDMLKYFPRTAQSAVMSLSSGPSPGLSSQEEPPAQEMVFVVHMHLATAGTFVVL
jgi:hypothetical protein